MVFCKVSFRYKLLNQRSMLSILNHVLGPVIRGPSSSHTAGSYFIARLARNLMGKELKSAKIIFDPAGSYGQVYRQQCSDLGFAAGLLGWEIADERFPRALDLAAASGLEINFAVNKIAGADHPNMVLLELFAYDGERLDLRAKSIGGGMVEINEVNGWPTLIRGSHHDYLFVLPKEKKELFLSFSNATLASQGEIYFQEGQDNVLFHLKLTRAISAELIEEIRNTFPLQKFWSTGPLMPIMSGSPLFRSAAEALILARSKRKTLGKLAISYESQLLGYKEEEVRHELAHRLRIMKQAVVSGMRGDLQLQLLPPAAGLIYKAEKEGRLGAGGMLTRAAARAMAAQHTAAAMGVVCAAPTAGSAGTLPGVMVTLLEDKGLSEEKVVEALAAAGAIGLIVGYRATFAAEVAGCQVEIGAAGAMASAAAVEAAGGSTEQALDAAAISFQNTMGSVCDLVQGVCEIPCHTRNAVAAAAAFICADLVMGGYVNPIPLDETIDAVYEVGKMLPPELKVTSLGGLALCPSSRNLKKRPLKF